MVFGGYLGFAFGEKVAETGDWSLFMGEKEGYVSFLNLGRCFAFKIALNKRYKPYCPAENSMILTAAFIP